MPAAPVRLPAQLTRPPLSHKDGGGRFPLSDPQEILTP